MSTVFDSEEHGLWSPIHAVAASVACRSYDSSIQLNSAMNHNSYNSILSLHRLEHACVGKFCQINATNKLTPKLDCALFLTRSILVDFMRVWGKP